MEERKYLLAIVKKKDVTDWCTGGICWNKQGNSEVLWLVQEPHEEKNYLKKNKI